jgi:hypothetical protein
MDSLLTDCSQNYSCFGHTSLLLVKINNVTHLENPWSMTREPSIFRTYELETDVSGTDPLGAFEFHLTPNPSQVTLSSTSTPTLPPCLYNNRTQVTIVEVKDLRQTVAIEIGYRATNIWME